MYARYFLLAFLLGAPAVQAQVATVEITPTQAMITAGQTVKFRATARDEKGVVLDTVTIVFAAAPFDVAFAARDGTVRGLRQGTVQVLAIAQGKVATASLTVAPKPPARVTLAPAPSAVVSGGSFVLAATAATEDDEPLRDAKIAFSSSNPAIASVDAAGLVIGRAPGTTTIRAESGSGRAETRIRVVANPVSRIDVSGAASARTGDVIRFQARPLNAQGAAVSDVAVNWSVSGPGATVHADGAFVAERPGTHVINATVGNVTAATAISVSAREHGRKLERVFVKPFPDIQVAEHWAIGNVLYVSTVSDRVYTFDITDPANPVLADSIVVDARHINDVSTTSDGRIGVITRENASSRVNGIVFLDLSQPLHPKVLSEYTSTVTGGVHSAFVDGTYVYLTDDATGSLRVVDFRDVKQPREVARWELPGVRGATQEDTGSVFIGASVGRYLHDVQVKDGLAYLAYWRHGLIILDVGAGIAGGSPQKPQLVSRLTYNVADFYPPDRIAGTHTAFRYGNYVFVGDEVFPPVFNLTSRDRIEAMGWVHVVDVSDIRSPRKVAEYRVAGGAHNVWVHEDVLYIGAYEGGVRALDVSGELRGDLVSQGREIGAVWTGHPNGFRPNLPFAWGAQPHRGFIFTTDINSGLWVTRLTPKITS
jgi:hypothetical protein